MIDARTRTVAKTIPVDREPVGAWPGPDGVMYVEPNGVVFRPGG